MSTVVSTVVSTASPPAPSTSLASPAALGPVVVVRNVVRAEDLFLCTPLRTKLTAGACVQRQAMANPAARKALTPGERVVFLGGATYGSCRACPLGQEVRARLAAAKAPAKMPLARRRPAGRHWATAHYCSCGKVAYGNGGKAAHAAKHRADRTSFSWVEEEGSTSR